MAAQADTNREKLQSLLRELFQFDTSDLDFGVYRILNQRRDEIERFIEEDLLDAVDEALEHLQKKDVTDLELEVEEKRGIVEDSLGEEVFTDDGGIEEEYQDLKAAREYLDAREHLEQARAQAQVGEETEARIFNDLYRFFSRYYEDGDFHTKRRFSSRDSKFYVPYDGEETLFHWANRDQYYIKTSEHFSEYRFEVGDLTVEFQLEEANVPQDNVKGDERYFVLSDGEAVAYRADQDIVAVKFQYRQITEEEAASIVETYNDATGDDRKSLAYKTNTILCTALETQILAELDDATVEVTLGEPDEGDTQSPLRSHLTRYTAEHTMDYFIHKGLEDFLRRELDFFLKNEILDVDELLTDGDRSTPAPVTLRAQVIRDIAERIITFLAQIEDFQKRLFEKKKFVVQTDYMVTLDHVPDELYEVILENEEQLEQWRDVYNIDEWENSLFWNGSFDHSFLENHPHLMVDTALFDEEFKAQLLARFENLDDALDGVLIHGENFQALNLLSEKYRSRIKTAYVDPPYNTGNDEFLYKDNYRHSSWLSLLADRVTLARFCLQDDGLFFSSIDDREYHRLVSLLNAKFSEPNKIASFVWKRRTSTAMRGEPISPDHEYVVMYAKSREEADLFGLPPDPETFPYEDERGRYKSSDLTVGMTKEQRPNQFYPIENPRTGVTYQPNPDRVWRFQPTTMEEVIEDDLIIWPDEEGERMERPRYKTYYDPENLKPKPVSTWVEEASVNDVRIDEVENDYLVSLLQTHRNEEGGRTLRDMLPGVGTYYPKPVSLIRSLLRASTSPSDSIIDFFAGSGTTGHAVMDLNQADEGDRKYILVEFGEYFDTVLRPRLQKRALSANWSDGVPDDRNGQSHLIRYQRLESYDDTLNNIQFRQPEGPQQQLVSEELDDYTEGYLLEFETDDSPPLLPQHAFGSPFSFKLQIEQNGASPQPTTVDLVETFHYLIGARVRRYRREEHQGRSYVLTESDVRTETGTDRILTIWRDTEDLDLEEEAEWIEATFEPQTYNHVYINTESYVNEAEPIEVTFRERMEASPRVS